MTDTMSEEDKKLLKLYGRLHATEEALLDVLDYAEDKNKLTEELIEKIKKALRWKTSISNPKA